MKSISLLFPLICKFFNLKVNNKLSNISLKRFSSKNKFLENSTKKVGFHERNPFGTSYDIPSIVFTCPELENYLKRIKETDEISIDFSEQKAVKLLNRGLLFNRYNLKYWDFPDGYLIPPIPGRAEYIHHIADLISENSEDGELLLGGRVRGLDIGTGSTLIYPLIGHLEYGWNFTGSDIDLEALKSADKIISENSKVLSTDSIKLCYQKYSNNVFKNIFRHKNEKFVFSMCNPPFHSSMAVSFAGTDRKWRGLGREDKLSDKLPLSNTTTDTNVESSGNHVLNFGGRELELSCKGGEVGFIKTMIDESSDDSVRCRIKWFTCIVSKKTNMATLKKYIKNMEPYSKRPFEVREIDMSVGNKKFQFLAWTYTNLNAKSFMDSSS
jgi:23S rRNA (adenine1618-N6)-methyltransferase